MEFNDYQDQSRKTRLQGKDMDIRYFTLGLAGEAGEVAEYIKKLYRDDNGALTDERREALKKELGDVLWYLAQLATDLELTLDDVATHNLEKLASRKERKVIHGDGDNR